MTSNVSQSQAAAASAAAAAAITPIPKNLMGIFSYTLDQKTQASGVITIYNNETNTHKEYDIVLNNFENPRLEDITAIALNILKCTLLVIEKKPTLDLLKTVHLTKNCLKYDVGQGEKTVLPTTTSKFHQRLQNEFAKIFPQASATTATIDSDEDNDDSNNDEPVTAKQNSKAKSKARISVIEENDTDSSNNNNVTRQRTRPQPATPPGTPAPFNFVTPPQTPTNRNSNNPQPTIIITPAQTRQRRSSTTTPATITKPATPPATKKPNRVFAAVTGAVSSALKWATTKKDKKPTNNETEEKPADSVTRNRNETVVLTGKDSTENNSPDTQSRIRSVATTVNTTVTNANSASIEARNTANSQMDSKYGNGNATSLPEPDSPTVREEVD